MFEFWPNGMARADAIDLLWFVCGFGYRLYVLQLSARFSDDDYVEYPSVWTKDHVPSDIESFVDVFRNIVWKGPRLPSSHSPD